MEPSKASSKAHSEIIRMREYLKEHIVGQDKLIDRLLLALLADGHLLVEGAPGLAKTKAIKILSSAIEGDGHRIQFTPDLLPTDLTGSDIYKPGNGTFEFKQGPIFHNLVLADEINRAPAKVQSALLEAMGEHQITIGMKTYQLPELFLVMATQNPIEQEGTYPLPEAQLDRFLMYVKIDQPGIEAERKILSIVREETKEEISKKKPNSCKPIAQKDIMNARKEVLDVHLSPALEEYIVQLIIATRDPSPYGTDLIPVVTFGSSPRGTIALDRCSRAYAWLDGRDFVTPDDVQAVARDILRHRIILTFEAEAEGMSTDDFLNTLLKRVPLP
ncbi:MAG: MoxR family ATPase [Alphaproteobacteria bacterium]|nr:MoxR family ATPase [Alphaproteobacteria bacterium]